MSIFSTPDPRTQKEKTLISFTKQSRIYYRSMYEKNSLSKQRSVFAGNHLTKRYNFLADSFYNYITKPIFFKRGNNFLLTSVQ